MFQLIWLLLVLFYSIDLIYSRDENAREDAFLTPVRWTDFLYVLVKIDKNCFQPQLIKKYGYPVEVHYVETRDGYILEVHRIPHGKSNDGNRSRKPVLVNHGILCSSADFVITGPDQALGYTLADAGFDVWITNARGNTYARNHTYLSPKSAEFWNFDIHEVGIYDLPATIDYILSETNHKKLVYVGFSQGTTTFYILASLLPEYNAKIELQISLAPVAFLAHTNLPLGLLFGLNLPLFTFLRLLGVHQYFPVSETRTKITNALCDQGDILQSICMRISTVIESISNLNKTTWIAVQGHFPAGVSWKQWMHYGQLFNSGKFRQYDYGFLKNGRIYGRKTPPEYDLKKVTAPVILVGGDNDLLATQKDIDELEKNLPNILERYTVPDPKFNHGDFIWGMDAKKVVYKFVVDKIKQYTG